MDYSAKEIMKRLLKLKRFGGNKCLSQVYGLKSDFLPNLDMDRLVVQISMAREGLSDVDYETVTRSEERRIFEARG